MLEKSELKYIGLATLFGIVWFILILPNVLNYVGPENYILSFLLFNIGFSATLLFVFKSISSGQKFEITKVLGLVIIFMGLGLFAPPYYISTSGEFLSGPILYFTSTDYFFGHLWASVGISGSLLYFFTFMLTPLLLFLLGALILKNFTKSI